MSPINIFVTIASLLPFFPSCSGPHWLTNSDVQKATPTSEDLVHLLGNPVAEDPRTLQGSVKTTELLYLVLTKKGIVEERAFYYRSDNGVLERFSRSYSNDPDPKFRVLNYSREMGRELIEEYLNEHPHLGDRLKLNPTSQSQ